MATSRADMRLLSSRTTRSSCAPSSAGCEREGYAVDSRGDGDEALCTRRGYDYDAIVLDVMLPGLDGFAVCEALRRGERWMPVLMLTARDRASATGSGASTRAPTTTSSSRSTSASCSRACGR